MRVFISSTQKDLVPYRQLVKEKVERLGMEPVVMESFSAADATPIEVCRKKVQDCDLFVGIYAHRYGFKPDGYDISITEMEYKWAQEAGIPTHIFVVDKNYDWPGEWRDQGDDALSLLEFKKRLQKDHVWKEFTTPESLAFEVIFSLTHDLDKISRERQQQRLLLVSGLAVMALLLMAVILAIVLTRPDEAARADREATLAAVAIINQTSTAAMWTPTPTITPTFTPTFTPSPTPLEASPAVPGTVAAVLALEDGGGRLSALGDELEQTLTIPVIRISHNLQGREQAREVSEIYQTAFVIWGTVEADSIILHFEVTPHRKPTFYPQGYFDLTSQILPYFEIHVSGGEDHASLIAFIESLQLVFDNQYRTALRALEPIAEQLSDDASPETQTAIRFYHGLVCTYRADYECALTNYNRVIELNPDVPLFYLDRGRVYWLQDNYRAAVDDFTQAITLDPEYALAYAYRGSAYRLMADYSEAKIDLDRAIQLAPDMARAYYWRGRVYFAQELYDPAWEEFNRAIEIDPEYADAYDMRGSATFSAAYARYYSDDPALRDAMNENDAEKSRAQAILKSYEYLE